MSNDSDLIGWLTQILDEDARGWKLRIDQEGAGHTEHLRMWGKPFPELMLADIAAKRAVIDDYKRLLFDDPFRRTDYFRGQRDALEYTVKHLAEAYADRPGYREDWRAA